MLFREMLTGHPVLHAVLEVSGFVFANYESMREHS